MRTDAKIGFAIGGVLLAVLTVYAIVVPKHKKPTNTTVVLAPAPAGSSTPDSSAGSTPPLAAGDSETPVTTPPLPAAPAKETTTTFTPPAVSILADNVTPPPAAGGFHPLDASAGALPKSDDSKSGKLMDGVFTPAETDHPRHVKAPLPSLPDEADTAAASSSDRVYTIKSGQTLSTIAYEVYGNSRFWVAIQRENKTLNPNRLKVGAKINLPDITPIEPGPITVSDEEVATPDPTPVHSHRTQAPASAEAHSYIVKSGDSLYGIARKLLGSGRRAEALYALNKEVIGPDKSRLKLGMVLKLPVESASLALAATASAR